jgi:catalase
VAIAPPFGLSDRALTRSYRMMEGFGVHTFRWVNAEGEGRFIKWHWRPVLGTASLVWDETQKIGGKNSDFNRQALWEAIEMGDYPEFELCVQMIEESREHDFDFDILDATKLWPESDVPLMKIGRMVLNGTRTTSSPRPSRSPSTRGTWCRGSTSRTTRCCRGGSSRPWTRS